MSPKQNQRKLAPTFKLPVPVSDTQRAALDKLEARAEQRGQGVAGRSGPVGHSATRASSKLRRETRGERVAGYLPAELEHELRVFCARERRSVSDVLTEAVERLIAGSDSAKSA